MSDADDPIMSDEQGEQPPAGEEMQAPAITPPDPGVIPAPSNTRIALYVLASGEMMGQAVPVVVMEQHEYPEGFRANLAKVDAPTLRYQTLALYSEGKEPGTWHWA